MSRKSEYKIMVVVETELPFKEAIKAIKEKVFLVEGMEVRSVTFSGSKEVWEP